MQRLIWLSATRGIQVAERIAVKTVSHEPALPHGTTAYALKAVDLGGPIGSVEEDGANRDGEEADGGDLGADREGESFALLVVLLLGTFEHVEFGDGDGAPCIGACVLPVLLDLLLQGVGGDAAVTLWEIGSDRGDCGDDKAEERRKYRHAGSIRKVVIGSARQDGGQSKEERDEDTGGRNDGEAALLEGVLSLLLAGHLCRDVRGIDGSGATVISAG